MKLLWSPQNKTLYSSAFSVAPGYVGLLFATGLELYKVRTSASEIVGPQTVCVRRLLFGFDGYKPEPDLCGWIFNMDNVQVETLVDSLVHVCGLPWQLTACRNIGIIGVPGNYRLELNDSTAIGTAQVYAEIYNIESIPLQVKDLFF